MNRKTVVIVLILTAFILASARLLPKKSESSFALKTQEKSFVAGSKIVLEFENKSMVKAQLFLAHSYGKTLLDGIVQNEKLLFELPSDYCEKSGMISWF
jgi:hypothetical protein